MHRDTTLIQIVPAGYGGVRDYALCLQSQWQGQGVASQIVATSQASGAVSLTEQIEMLLKDSNATAATRCALVLHYSGYGYGARGLCFWLVDALRQLRTQHSERLRLTVVFHELFASGPPWRSAFWLKPVQAEIALRLARLADAVWTNTAAHQHWLAGVLAPDVPILARPVFSNVGEREEGLPASARSATAVVFGSESTRSRVQEALRRQATYLRQLGVEEVIEVGSGPATLRSASLPCSHLGRLEQHALEAVLQSARFGLLDYPCELLGKSGVYAAYAAHGCVVINTRQPGVAADGLVRGRHYLCLADLSEQAGRAPPDATHDDVATLNRQWYTAHRLPMQARELLAVARG